MNNRKDDVHAPRTHITNQLTTPEWTILASRKVNKVHSGHLHFCLWPVEPASPIELTTSRMEALQAQQSCTSSRETFTQSFLSIVRSRRLTVLRGVANALSWCGLTLMTPCSVLKPAEPSLDELRLYILNLLFQNRMEVISKLLIFCFIFLAGLYVFDRDYCNSLKILSLIKLHPPPSSLLLLIIP